MSQKLKQLLKKEFFNAGVLLSLFKIPLDSSYYGSILVGLLDGLGLGYVFAFIRAGG